MRLLSFALLAVLTACSGSSDSSGGTTPDGTTPPGQNPPGTNPPGTNPPGAVPAGAVDPSCGNGGFVDLPDTLSGMLEDPKGALLLASGSIRFVDNDGKLDPTPRARSYAGIVRTKDGGAFAWTPLTGGQSQVVDKLTSTSAVDTSFAFEKNLWPGNVLDAVAPNADGSIYVLGAVDLNTSQEHMVVRRFLPNGKADTVFKAPDDDMPKELVPKQAIVLSDGRTIVRTDQGFTPALVALTKDGKLDTSFGKQGVLVLTMLGPRYGRQMLLDAQGRLLVLGMTNDDVQIVRLSGSGELDPTYGDAGIAHVSLASKTKPSSGFEATEARGMIFDASGGLVVTTMYGIEDSGGPTKNQATRLVHFDANGKLDASFGKDGFATVDFGSGTTSEPFGPFVKLGATRALVAAQKRTGTTVTNAIACVKL